MKLIDRILSGDNLADARKSVLRNKGSSGIDGMSVQELDDYWHRHSRQIREDIANMRYKPQPVRRVYIPKPNGKKRPLGIPTVVDRMIQQATAQVLDPIFDPAFSDSSFGFRRGRSAHDAIRQALEYLNDGYEWVIDLDIEKFFDRVNHDKLISCIRKKVNEKEVLHLIRGFLKAGVMEEGQVTRSDLGTPQGGCISPLLANIYLDEFDKELERRELRFCRYADDVVIFVRTEKAANRVMASVSSWLERKLFLTVSPTKTHVCRPSRSTFLGFTFWKSRDGWKAKPADDRKQRLYDKIREELCRKRAVARPLAETFTKVNQIVRGWINYFSIGSMKGFLDEFGQWLRHKIRVIIVKQWKRPKTIFRNLTVLNRLQIRLARAKGIFRPGFSQEAIRQTANTRLGLYRMCGMRTINYLLSPEILAMPKEDRPGLVDPLKHYLSMNS